MNDPKTTLADDAALGAPQSAPGPAAVPEPRRSRAVPYGLLAAGVCAVCFLTVAPFLSLFEFSNGGENAVVASVQEIHRGGPWLVPTLHEEQRTKKPPLATWLSALASDAQTVARQSDPDPAVRDAAFRAFGWQVRWPALLAMCGVVAATFGLGRAVGGPRLGLVACLVCGSSFFWLRNARMTTTDAHLALWVGVANCLLAPALLDGRRRWLALVGGGGVALGLAMMSKGPVALLQTVAPALAFLAWRRWWWDRQTIALARVHVETPDDWPVSYAPFAPRVEPRSPERPPTRGWLAPLMVGLAVFVVVGFTWYLLVWRNNPEVIKEWRRELTREGATGLPPSKWYAYAGMVHSLFPWCMFFVVGLLGMAMIAVRRGPGVPGDDEARERAGRAVLPLMLLLTPILVMSFFRDRELRYLIPLLAPASVVAAWGILDLLVTNARRWWAAGLVVVFHWLPLAGAAVAPLFASDFGWIRTMAGEPMFSLRFAILAAEVMLVLVIAAVWLQRRRPVYAVAGGTALAMMLWGVVLNIGYRQHREGRSELRPLADLILAERPGAVVYSFRPDKPIRKAPIDLSIYLNRVVENVLDLGDVERSPGDCVLLIRYKAGQPAPPPPAGWTLFAQTPNDDSVWYAYTPPASAPTSGPTTATAPATDAAVP